MRGDYIVKRIDKNAQFINVEMDNCDKSITALRMQYCNTCCIPDSCISIKKKKASVDFKHNIDQCSRKRYIT